MTYCWCSNEKREKKLRQLRVLSLSNTEKYSVLVDSTADPFYTREGKLLRRDAALKQ